MKKYILVVACCLSLVGMQAQAIEEQVVTPDLSGVEVLNLRTAQEIALAGNPDMVSAQARIEQARARVSQAVAAWWPSVDLIGVGRQERLSDSAYEASQALASVYGTSADRTNDNFSTGLQATWMLFDGFFRNFNEKKARYDEEANISGLLNSQRLLVVSVAEAFLNAQLAQTNVDIAKADKAFYTRQLEDAR